MRQTKRISGRNNRKTGITIYLLGVVLAIMLFALAGRNVSGNSSIFADEREYYHELENTYREVIRQELAELGYSNSGITMSSMIELDGSRSYHIILHHDRISRLNIEEQEELMAGLNNIQFPEQSCMVEFEVLQ
ncbi:MAG TPA: hypothetical protein PLZ77_09395 [Lachnospiraceae bacterium]|nr:hypothetical protein [Lachnospiraceae bacterium]HPF30298.1 hypothetical protein [Lachnospiraceae bacterium]